MSDVVKVMMERLGKRHEARVPFKKAVEFTSLDRGSKVRLCAPLRALLTKEDWMKTNILTMSVIGMIALLGLGVQPSLANPEPGTYGEMRGHHPQQANHLQHLLKHQKELGLTEEQVKKLKAIQLDFDRARIRLEAEIHVNEREVQALVEGEEQADLSKVEAKLKQSEILGVALRMSAFKARNEALAVLTPDQRAKGKAAHEKPEPRPEKPEPRP